MAHDEWGPWIEHDGTLIPKDVPGSWAEIVGHDPWGCVVKRQGRVNTGAAFLDVHGGFGPRVIFYRIRKPRGMVVLESLLADLPEKVTG